MEDVRRCKKRGGRLLLWMSARQVPANISGGLEPADCAGVGLAGGSKTVAGTYFRGRGACTQYDPKVILGAKTLDPKGEAYYGC